MRNGQEVFLYIRDIGKRIIDRIKEILKQIMPKTSNQNQTSSLGGGEDELFRNTAKGSLYHLIVNLV